jgi:flagellar biosynthesis protein FlhA
MANPTSTSTAPAVGLLQQSEMMLSAAMLVGLVVMLIPLPPLVLDGLLALNLGITTLLLLVTLSAKRAMELSVFPSLLLLLTLYRLSLNVATTRLILLDGNAGNIVRAFGNYVVGGNLVVGLVIFLILVTIQFMVITKGAGRVSEVAARFTLDALPGKQMAIDAELAAGQIDGNQARRRRDELSHEAEFYGAMDGASKFVRGDAIAGLIITAVNLIGGVVIGMSTGQSFLDSVNEYSILTVGDGLVSQIPALIIATTAGVLVTKTTSDDSLGDEIRGQLLNNQRSIWVGAGILAVIAMMPGLPKLPFLGVAAVLVIFFGRSQPVDQPAEAEDPGDGDTDQPQDDSETLESFLLADRAVVELGSSLAPHIRGSRKSKGLAERITAMRREFSQSRGNWIPPIRVTSNQTLDPDEYCIRIAGRRVAGSDLRPDRMLAILPEGLSVNIVGEPAKEPAFGLESRWIEPEATGLAERQGCTVVDPLSVLITHLGEILKRHAHELLTREALAQMLRHIEKYAPAIVEEIKPETIRMGTLHQTLVRLAEDRIPLSDFAFILETIVNNAHGAEEVDQLVDRVRVDLGRLVCEPFRDTEGRLRVLTMEPHLDSQLRKSLHEGQLAVAAGPLTKLIEASVEAWSAARRVEQPLALLVDQHLRRPFRRILARSAPELGIIAYQEVPSDMIIESAEELRFDQIFGVDPSAAQGTTLPTDHNPLLPADGISGDAA